MRIAHVFAHEATNLGDIYLKRATQQAFRTIDPGARFTEVEIRRIFSRRDIAALNAHDLVLIGGGGLLLRDTFPNDVSDWQWGCSVDLLRDIQVPIVVYAIGYNRFRGQEDFCRPLFDRHIGLLMEKSVFFSARNTGSVQALKKYVSPELGDRIVLNQCPSILFPNAVVERPLGTGKVGLLLAGDRLHLRHPDMDGFLRRLRTLVEELSRHAEIHVVAHQPQDLWFLDALKGIPLEVTELIGASPDEAIPLYSALDVVIADRGHAQMIPFGLGCKIVSLVSHEKLKWFLEDMGLEDFGVEESDPEMPDRVLSLVFPATKDSYSDRRLEALRAVSVRTHGNLHDIRERLSA